MKPWLLLAVLLAVPGGASAEDLQLRQTAVALLERADAASTPTSSPQFEQVVNFRVFDSGGQMQEGQFTRVSAPGQGRRDEFTLGDFHLLNIFTGSRLAVKREGKPMPPEVRQMLRLVPIELIRFDRADVIRSIGDGVSGDRPTRCIAFDTSYGAVTHANEICVDKQDGTLLRFRDGSDVVENSAFFPFGGALIPARISLRHDGVLHMEISQTMTAVSEPLSSDVFTTPAGARQYVRCQQFRRAFGQQMPQPAPGNGGEAVDVVLHGTIAVDGRVHDAVVEQTDHPEFSAEALGTIARWLFTPATCNGNPIPVEGNFVLHFQGR